MMYTYIETSQVLMKNHLKVYIIFITITSMYLKLTLNIGTV